MLKTSEILAYLRANSVMFDFDGDPNSVIHGFCPLKDLKEGCVTFSRNPDTEICRQTSIVKNLLIITTLQDGLAYGCNVIKTHNPHRAFFLVIENFFYHQAPIHRPELSLVETNQIGDHFNIGPFSYIGKDVSIGKNVSIGSHVSIENHVIIGDNVTIEAGARIGTWGFGRYLNPDGTSKMIPHLGGVTINSNVFIGANSIISRGTLADTVIMNDVLIDGDCYIAHNVLVKARTIVTGGVGIAGSAEIGEDVWLAPRCVINSGIHIGDRAFIGMGSIVTHDIPDDMYAFGIPAKVICANTDKKYKL